MTPRRLVHLLAVLVPILCCHSELHGQQAGLIGSAHGNSTSHPVAVFPEDGYLSHDRYTNAFFGFWLEFPEQSYLKPIPMPLAPADREDLLEVLGPAPAHAQISIAAFPPGPQRPPDPKGALRKLLDQELAIGVEELHGLSKTRIADHPFYTFETRRGVDQHAIYASEMNGYIVRFILSGRDPKVVQQLQKCLGGIKFVAPETASQYAGLGATAYQGPSIPHHVLQALNSDPPAGKIEQGVIQGSIYDNRQLGLSYVLPKDWTIGREGAVQPAVERWRMRNSPPSQVDENERTLRSSCERILFSAWKTQPQPGQDVLYDDFGEVTVSAMALSCFPTLRFPSDLDQQNPIRDFLSSYNLTHPIMRDMKGARAFETGGKIFVVSQGVVAYQTEGEALSRRVSIAIALTQQHGYLLSFFFAAPHDSELRELMNAKAAFDPEPRTPESTAEAKSGPAGNQMTPANAALTMPAVEHGLASAQMGSTPLPHQPHSPQPSSSDGSSTYADDGQAAPSRPTLLKPGESMKDQQMSGAPLPQR